MRDLEVYGVEVALDGSRVVLMLKDTGSEQVLPIVVGAREGAAIASVQAGLASPRPMTHDLLLSTIRALGSEVSSLVITEQVDGVYYAELHLVTGERIDCRPSDGVAVALRAGVQVRCADELFASARTLTELGMGAARTGRREESGVEDQVAELRKELERLGPEGFTESGTES